MANVIEITDFSAPELDVYARLTEAQLLNRFEPARGMFIAESPKVIHRALDGGYEPVSLLMERKDITGAAREVLARCPGVPVYTADEELLCNLTGYHLTRGVLCAMRRPGLPTVEDICAGAARIVVLENVQNPTNVGAIFRSAAALGMDAVLLTPGCSDRCTAAAPGKHGDGVSDSLDVYGRLAGGGDGAAAPSGLQNRRHGAERRFRLH